MEFEKEDNTMTITGCNPNAELKRTDVQEAISSLDNERTRLFDAVKVIEDRLIPVLSGNFAEGNKVPVPEIARCPLATIINDNVTSIHNSIIILENIIARLQL
jgi:hypothetical protein